MKAKLKERVIADSDDIVEDGGYSYFPSAAVRLDLLRKANKTVSDRACPHGVQFYASASGTRSRWAEAIEIVDRRDEPGHDGSQALRPLRYSHTGSFSSCASAVMAASSSATKSSYDLVP
jgi:hypothetical protein